MTEGNKIPVAVLILNYKGADVLDDCLASWTKMDPPAQEVLVIDNASDDGSIEAVRGKYPQFKWQILEKNWGFAAGNNKGIQKILDEQKDIEAIFLCNNDTTVEKDMLGLLWAEMQAHEKWAALGPRILMQDSGKIWFEGASVGEVLGRSFHWKWGENITKAKEAFELPKWGFVTGCGLLMRSSVLREIGDLDEGMWAYSEDSDWCFRARRAGWNSGVVANASMTHAVSATFSKTKAPAAYLAMRNSLELIRRHRIAYLGLLWPITLLNYIFVVSAWRALKVLLQGDLKVLRAMLLGIVDFAKGEKGPVKEGLL